MLLTVNGPVTVVEAVIVSEYGTHATAFAMDDGVSVTTGAAYVFVDRARRAYTHGERRSASGGGRRRIICHCRFGNGKALPRDHGHVRSGCATGERAWAGSGTVAFTVKADEVAVPPFVFTTTLTVLVGAALMTNEYVCVEELEPTCAFMEKLNVPFAVGIPEIVVVAPVEVAKRKTARQSTGSDAPCECSRCRG